MLLLQQEGKISSKSVVLCSDNSAMVVFINRMRGDNPAAMSLLICLSFQIHLKVVHFGWNTECSIGLDLMLPNWKISLPISASSEKFQCNSLAADMELGGNAVILQGPTRVNMLSVESTPGHLSIAAKMCSLINTMPNFQVDASLTSTAQVSEEAVLHTSMVTAPVEMRYSDNWEYSNWHFRCCKCNCIRKPCIDSALTPSISYPLNDKEITLVNTLDKHLKNIQKYDDGLLHMPYAVSQQLVELVISTLEHLGVQNTKDVALQWRAHCFYAAGNFWEMCEMFNLPIV